MKIQQLKTAQFNAAGAGDMAAASALETEIERMTNNLYDAAGNHSRGPRSRMEALARRGSHGGPPLRNTELSRDALIEAMQRKWQEPRPDDEYENRGDLLPIARNKRTKQMGWAWPGSVLKIARSARSGVTLPRDTLYGRVDPMSDEGFARVMDLTGLVTGTPVGTGLAKQGRDIAHEAYHTGRVVRQLENPAPKTTKFGKINRDTLKAINKIRVLENKPPIDTRNVNIYRGVFEKFQRKRLDMDGMSSQEVADAIYRLIHGKRSSVERGQYDTSHRLVNERVKPREVGFVGLGLDDDVSVKSIFRLNDKKLSKMRDRQTRGGKNFVEPEKTWETKPTGKKKARKKK